MKCRIPNDVFALKSNHDIRRFRNDVVYDIRQGRWTFGNEYMKSIASHLGRVTPRSLFVELATSRSCSKKWHS